MAEDYESSGRKNEIMEALCNTIRDNNSSSLRRSLIREASRMGHASELKAGGQTCGRCSPRSSSSSRDFWQLTTCFVVCDPPNAPDMALNDSFYSQDDPEILEQSLTIPHTIPKSRFQRCSQQRQKCWTCRINSEWDDDDDDNNNNNNQLQRWAYCSSSTQSGNFRKHPLVLTKTQPR